MSTRLRIAARFHQAVSRRLSRWSIAAERRAEKFFLEIKRVVNRDRC